MRKVEFLKIVTPRTHTLPLGDELDSPTVKVRELTAAQRDEMAAIVEDDNAPHDAMLVLRRKLCVMALLGDDGEPMFADDEEAAQVGREMAAGMLDKVWRALKVVSGLDADSQEEIEGN